MQPTPEQQPADGHGSPQLPGAAEDPTPGDAAAADFSAGAEVAGGAAPTDASDHARSGTADDADTGNGPVGTDATDTADSTAEAGTGAAAMSDGPRPLGVPVEPTGRPEIDALLHRLAEVDHLGVAGHLGVYDYVDGGLRDALTALDDAPEPPAPGVRHDSRS